jgi:2-polyprenyl-3-methyl-5-hydroxy-6-metoxy-1,4-benzoquinol methylase
MMLQVGRFLRKVILLLSRLVHALERTAPVFLSVTEMERQVRGHYMADRNQDEPPIPSEPPHLAAWEQLVLDRYKIDAGRMLVLGAGWGRESIAIAGRGVSVVGLDSSRAAVRQASRLAARESVPATFQQGNFLVPPYRPASFDHLLLSCNMYSAIPGCTSRQAWLNGALYLIKPGGVVIVSFLPRFRPVSRLRAWSNRFNRWLMRLPGANRGYQVGDICYEVHFLHEFQDESELRGELAAAGASILEVNWDLGYAVLSNREASVRSGTR